MEHTRPVCNCIGMQPGADEQSSGGDKQPQRGRVLYMGETT